jgi:hypothetical protein
MPKTNRELLRERFLSDETTYPTRGGVEAQVEGETASEDAVDGGDGVFEVDESVTLGDDGETPVE